MKLSAIELRSIIREEMKYLMNDDALFKSRDDHTMSKSDQRMRDIDSTGRNLSYGHTKSDDSEGMSTKNALYSLIQNSMALYDLIEDNDDLPEWVQGKVSVASDNITSVFEYLDHKLHTMGL